MSAETGQGEQELEFIDTPFVHYGTTTFVNLRHASCQHRTKDDDDCPFLARYFAVTQWGKVIGMCGHHVPDHWFTDDYKPDVYDALDIPCEKHLVVRDEMDVIPLDCGRQASILVVGEDDDYAVCLRHARQSWKAALRNEPGEDDEADV